VDVRLPNPVGIGGKFVFGVGLLVRGFWIYARSPRLVVLGLVPALITGILFIVGLVVLGWNATDLADVMTPFADDWTSWARSALRVAVAVALVGAGALLGVLTFTAVTLALGDPFYEKISEWVEEQYGGVPDSVEVSWWRSLGQSAADSARLIGTSAGIALPLLFVGFIPVVGQIVATVLGALVGGWMLAVELTGAAFSRRGQRLEERRQALRAIRPVTLGFGVAVFVAFLVPLGAVLFMPAAVAGATLLARHALGQLD
jgi:CysZ protein